ncbi:MAG TPA: hypothetical protein VGM82_05715 [Gemmatimonadaceae bacterium]|jgi:hypothetical protein
MKSLTTPLAGGAFAILVGAASAAAQQRIAVVDLPAATSVTSETIGSVIGIRQLPDGRVLVDDGDRRQLRLFDNALAASSVVLDSSSGTTNSYGRRPSPLVAYLADSTLFPDYAARALLVIDPDGRVARTLALPNPNDVGLVTRSASADSRGRLLYLGNRHSAPGEKPGEKRLDDSLPILRADLDSRRTDTIAKVARPLAKAAIISPDGRSTVTVYLLDPLRTIDEWTMLSDGSIAVVRGHDYHIDWWRPDGAHSSGSKLPFDWKRIDDANKQRIVDSAQAKLDKSLVDGTFMDNIGDIESIDVIRRSGNAPMTPPSGAGSGGRGGGGGDGRGGGAGGGLNLGFQGFVPAPREVIPLDQIADYYPAIRSGAVTSDLDGNLWILPTTSTQSQKGELVYDVVNGKGELFERVRLPVGRLLVGFAKGGVIYMVAGDRASGFHLERTALPQRAGSSR